MFLVCFPLNSVNTKELLFSANSTVQMMYDKEVTHYDQHFQPKISSPGSSHVDHIITRFFPELKIYHHSLFIATFLYFSVKFQIEKENKKNSTISCNLLRIEERT